MKILKIIALALVALPLSVDAAPKPKPSQSTAAEQSADLYPKFDNTLAASLWGMWRHDETQFSQKDYAQVLDLCIAAYDYLNEKYVDILNSCTSTSERERVAADFNDIGKSGNMVTFVRTFSNRMQHLASKGLLDEANYRRTVMMLQRKQEFKRLNDAIHY